MAKKSEEIIEKPVASRGRPRKDASTSTAKKASKSKAKKKTTKKASSSKKSVSKKTTNSTSSKKIEIVELVQDVQLETIIENPIISEPVLEEKIEDVVNEIENVEQTGINVCAEIENKELNLDAKEKEIAENHEQASNEVISDVSNKISTEVTPKTKKRTIRNISIKRPSVAEIENKPEVQEEIVEKTSLEDPIIEDTPSILEPVSVEEKIIVLPKKEKRTLRLNLGSHKKQETISEQSHKKDESINQNSSFFNEPSIFAKFNIDITSTESEDFLEKSNPSVEETSTSEEVNFNQTNIEQIDESQEEIISNTEITEENISEELSDEQIEDLIENTLINELQTIEEPNEELLEKVSATSLSDEDIEKAILEEISETISEETIENEIENSEILNSVRSILGGKLGTLEDLSSNTSENTTIIENETIVENNIAFKTDDVEIENEEQHNEFLEISQQEDVELKEVADSLNTAEPIAEKTSDNSPIGKFFDSSIPSMTSTVNNTFSKIKKSIFSNISPIFKKFTFEEATLRTHANELENNYIEPENNVSDIQKALENFTPNISATSNITEMNVQAEPVVSIPVIETDTLLSTEQSNAVYDIPELNIITPESESSYENVDNLEESTATETIDTDNLEESTTTAENIDNDLENNSLNLIEEEYNDDEFSIESYFGLDDVTLEEDNLDSSSETEISEEPKPSTSISENFADKFLEDNDEKLFYDTEEILEENLETPVEDKKVSEEVKETAISETAELEKTLKEKELEISNLSKLLESFTETISTLTNRITDLENKQLAESEITPKVAESNTEISETTENIVEELIENDSTESIENVEPNDLNLDDIDIEDLDLNDFDLNDFDIAENVETEIEEPSLLSQENALDEEDKSVESILSEVFLSKELDSSLKDELLSEVLSYEETLSEDESSLDDALLQEALLDELSDEDLTSLELTDDQEPLSDFSKIIDSLTKAITELEQTPDIKQEVGKKNIVTPLAPLPAELTNYTASEEKAINILINKDDIFSISILNETYEIVADFDGISVLSENLHISTPKNNFFVKIGNKYIEIHNKKDHFVLNTNFEDIEFANAINNIAFAKKNNKIELNIKEAFKLSSINNKIELSMLNKAIADLSSSTQSNETKDDSSICDNKTLLISEETQKVYLPYTIEDVMKKLKSGEDYQTVQDVVDKEYTLPLSTFKMPIISRFKEAYRFMRTKENSSVYAAVDLALELMFNSNLNPAVIRAAKDLKELNIYLDCLYENEVEKFDCFKIVYKVLPKIK